MTTRTDDGATDGDHGVDGADGRRYAALRLADGAVVIYDRTNTVAWIQSTSAVERERTN